MKIENISVAFIDDAIKYAGLPYRSEIKDATLKNLVKETRRSHSKFLRQMKLSCLIEAPLAWWVEFDTYKVGVTRMSSSIMNSILKYNIKEEDFEITEFNKENVENVIKTCNQYIFDYRNKKMDLKELKKTIKLIIPGSYIYKSFVTMNYEVLRSIYNDRKNHQLSWWRIFIDAFKDIPYYDDFIKNE